MQERHTPRWSQLTGTVLALAAALGGAPRAEAAVDRCLAVADGSGRSPMQGAVLRAAPAVGLAIERAVPIPVQARSNEVKLTFWGHSTFVIESPAGVRIATDYNDYIKPAPLPDIVTMNRAHNSHYTDAPEAGIRHVLRGWSERGGEARHDVVERDVRVRNIATNIRTWEGGSHIPFGNSIFVFEVAGLCIAHLGHLHHTLTAQQLGLIGQMDVVLVPVDGSYTLDLDGMVEVLQALRAPLMIPMHYFSGYTLGRFLDRVKGAFAVEELSLPAIELTRGTLPRVPTVRVLPGR